MNRQVKKSQRRKQLERLVAVLSAVVVLIVVGTLMQPANTMTTICWMRISTISIAGHLTYAEVGERLSE